MENQNRQYGGMGYENVYPPHAQPSHSQFSSEGWSSHSSSHPPPMYPSSAVSSSAPVTIKREELPRPPYSSVPVSAPSVVANGHHYSAPGYSGPEVMVVQSDIPRTTFDQSQACTTTSPINSFPPASYAPLDYAQSLHHQQHQQHPPPVHPDGRGIPPGSVVQSHFSKPRGLYH